jgi:drug/metabolite transporter (DMT)-like permease
MILVLAALFLSERVGRGVVLLSAIAIAGMTLVLWSPDGGGHVLGVLLTLAGVGSCAVYSVVTRRWLSTAGSTIQVVVVQQAYALVFAVLVLVGVALLGGRVWPTSLSVEGALSVAASGLVYYGLAYSFYLYGLRHVPASIAAVSFYLIPVFGIAAGSLLGERFDGRQWIGAVVVIVAVSMVAWRTSIAVTEAGVTNSS